MVIDRLDAVPFLRRDRSALRAFVFVLLSAVVVTAAAAQAVVPPLSGQVLDQSGAVLSGVSVQVTSTDRRTTQVTVTDASGRYAFAGVPAGQYVVTFQFLNFADVRRRGVAVSATAPARVDVTMLLALDAAVVVTAADTFRNLADLPHPEESLVGIATAASEGAVTARQIAARPIMRAGEVLEAVPGVIISQHSGEGKANQYYLRGFNLDHGTDFATTVAGLPINLPTHAHGQGYSDLNFLIPELVTGVQFRKGPYDAQDGDFAAAGSANINYANVLPHALASMSAGQDGWSRALLAASPRVGRGTLLGALEVNHHDGPWALPDDYRKVNAVLRYSQGNGQNAFSLTGMAYRSRWNSTDQVPDRAIADGTLSRFGTVDTTDGGETARYAAVAEFQRTSATTLTRATAYASRYRLNLFSNFTYFLEDLDRGDQFEQADRRWVTGGRVTQTRRVRWAGRTGESTYGVQIRHDDVPLVGLFRTAARRRIGVTRQDAVAQTSAGAFVTNELRWLPWLRTTAGLRLDAYRFRVDADDPANSGTAASTLVSPKGGVILGPWRKTELYVSAGTGHHSNDARGATITRDPSSGDAVEPVTPLVRATGSEVGIRTIAIPRLQSTVAIWRLDLASELLFIGDAGTTEASRPSRRHGIEWTNYLRLSSVLTADADLAWSDARFTDDDPAGIRIPGAARVVASLGVTVETTRGAFGSARLRYFGPRPLIEDDSVRSKATSLVNAQIGYHLTPRVHVVFDAFNVLNARASDVDYFYTSRLRGEPAAGVDDIHTHPTLPRTVRAVLRLQF
ncbi:MAG: TonB-dependent receptor [Acidobacteria bacterium]|nr:TonB-dependent receptor [Acidobacteriota bacterium]